MKNKRMIALILAFAMSILSFVFVGCEKDDGPGNDDPLIQPEYVELPDSFKGEKRDFEGMTFNILTRQDTPMNASGGRQVIDVVADDNLGDDAVVTAVRERNDRLKATFNFEIVRHQSADQYNNIHMQDIILKQDDSYQALQGTMTETLTTALSGALVDFKDTGSYVDLSQGYWDSIAIDALSLDGGVYLLTGDIMVGDDARSFCVVFNKELYNEETHNDASTIYNKVLEGVNAEGGWTLEYMKDVASSSYREDTSSNNIYEPDYSGIGTYGTICQGENALHIIQAANIMPLIKESSGAYYDNTGSQEFFDAFESLNSFFGGTDKDAWLCVVDRIERDNKWSEGRDNFKNDKTLFYFTTYESINQLRDMESEFGILPLPKVLNSQLHYGTTVQYYNAVCYSAPSLDYLEDGADERATYILEAMAYYSSPEYFEAMGAADTSLKRAYHETLLSRKATRDDESMEMLEIIAENRFYDLSIALSVGNIGGIISGNAASREPHKFISDLTAMPSLVETLEGMMSELGKDNK